MAHRKPGTRRRNTVELTRAEDASDDVLVRENGREYPIDSGIATFEKVAGYADSWNLLINGQYSSHITVGEPTRLSFPYMQWIAAGVAWFERETGTEPRRITHLGGAGCSLARYMAATYPSSRNTVVEIDSALADLARNLCDIPRAPHVKIRVGDARNVTESFRPASRDIVIRDVFSSSTPPVPLTTVGFTEAVQSSLAQPGLYAVNCGAQAGLDTAKREAATLRETFAHVALIADSTVLKGKRGGNIVFLASSVQLPQRDSSAATALSSDVMRGRVPAVYKDPAWVAQFSAGAAVICDPRTPQDAD